MDKLKARIRCALLTGHRMEKYQTKLVNGVYGKVEAYNSRCVDCKYAEKYWVAKEKGRQPVMYS